MVSVLSPPEYRIHDMACRLPTSARHDARDGVLLRRRGHNHRCLVCACRLELRCAYFGDEFERNGIPARSRLYGTGGHGDRGARCDVREFLGGIVGICCEIKYTGCSGDAGGHTAAPALIVGCIRHQSADHCSRVAAAALIWGIGIIQVNGAEEVSVSIGKVPRTRPGSCSTGSRGYLPGYGVPGRIVRGQGTVFRRRGRCASRECADGGNTVCAGHPERASQNQRNHDVVGFRIAANGLQSECHEGIEDGYCRESHSENPHAALRGKYRLFHVSLSMEVRIIYIFILYIYYNIFFVYIKYLIFM